MKLVQLAAGSKKPLAGADWHDRMSDDPEEHRRWLEQGYNLGLPLAENNVSVADFDDDLDAARSWYIAHRELATNINRSRRGVHFLFSGSTQTRKFPHGDIKGNGYIVYPPSIVDGVQYQVVRSGPLVPFPEELFPALVTNGIRTSAAEVRDAVKYISTIHAHSGQGGHNATFRAACKLADSGMTEAEALACLVQWSETNAHPKWSAQQLLHKVQSAFRRK